MDIEKKLRDELCERLSSSFLTEQEVSIDTLNGDRLRADVVALPLDEEFANTLLAFEVKTASSRNFNKWTHVFKQAADYVGARVTKGEWCDREIAAAFVFPAPPYIPTEIPLEQSDYWRSDEAKELSGVMHMASLFKAGAANIRPRQPRKGLNLSFGPNTLWNEHKGWFVQGKSLLSSKRLGSGKASRKT